MQKPNWLEANINLGNIINLVPLLVILASGAYGYGSLNNRIETMESFRAERTKQTDAKFEVITRAVENLPSLTYRITAQEEALKATNQRVDQSLQNISSRLAEMNQMLGAMDTKIAVLTQRFDSMEPERRRTMLLPQGGAGPLPIPIPEMLVPTSAFR